MGSDRVDEEPSVMQIGCVVVLSAVILAGMAQVAGTVYCTNPAKAVGSALPAAFISMIFAAIVLFAIGFMQQVCLRTNMQIGNRVSPSFLT